MDEQRVVAQKVKDLLFRYIADAPKRVERQWQMRLAMLGSDAYLDPDPDPFRNIETVNQMIKTCEKVIRGEAENVSHGAYLLGTLAGNLVKEGILNVDEATDLTYLKY